MPKQTVSVFLILEDALVGEGYYYRGLVATREEAIAAVTKQKAEDHFPRDYNIFEEKFELQIAVTPERLLELLEEYGFHISDGVGDHCSGYDNDAMLAASKELLVILFGGASAKTL